MYASKPPRPTGNVYDSTPKGVWIPIEIWDKLDSGHITFTEFRIYTRIDWLVHKRGEGCWASNEYLAEQTGISVRQVIRIVKKGIAGGILLFKGWKKVENKKFRILETVWSRIEPVRKKKIKSSNELHEDITSRRDKHVTRTHDIDVMQSELEEMNDKYCRESRSARRDNVRSPISSNDELDSPFLNELQKQDAPYRKELTELVSYFADRLRANGCLMRNYRAADWRSELDKLVKEIQERDEVSRDDGLRYMKSVMSWYVKNLNADHAVEAYSGKAFREKFIKIERSKKRMQQEAREKGEDVDSGPRQKVVHEDLGNGRSITRIVTLED